MLQHYLGLPDNDDEDVETISEVLIGAWATRVTQFLGPGASAEDAPGSTWPLPSTSITDLEYPHCQITLMTTTMPGTTNTDSEELTTTGEHNKLAVFVYNPNSEFKDAIDLEAGCVRRGRDKIYNMLNRFGFFAPACAANSEGAGAGSSSSGACLSNIAQIANILYGLRREGQNTVVRWCQQTITSMEITS
ncbi:MAG: hypothetical protein M1836_001477 [Candelina mexicana]|nr:MAG: hypothetical protein M1836_001477 [Candelina mexicana]